MPQATGDERTALLARTKELSDEVKAAEAAVTEAEAALRAAQLAVPNLVEDGAPAGGEDDYVVLREVGEQARRSTTRATTWSSARRSRAIDVERGAKVSGSRFYFLTGVGALLQLGLLQLAIAAGGRVRLHPDDPAGAGQAGVDGGHRLPRRARQRGLPARGRRPVPGRHQRGAAGRLPQRRDPRRSTSRVRYAGWSSCFRREAGSYGKDIRGIMRVHQFDKVEMFSYCRPEQAHDEHLRLLAWEEEMLAKVEIPYRVIDVAAGDLGQQRGPQVRLRGVGAVAGPVPRGHLDVELHDVPGPAAEHPLPRRRRAGRRSRRR